MNVFEYPMELQDYFKILTRRKRWFFAPFILVAGIATAVAFALPAIFKSEATFIIERQSIPQQLVATTVTGYIQEQIQQIRQRIVTHDHLVALAEKNHLAPEELAADPSAVVRELRDRIEVAMVDVQATDPNQGGVRFATIAFTLAVSAETPEMAQTMTNQLAERYLQEHRDAREQRAEEVSGFLESEASRLNAEIVELETALAAFKQDELRQLPEMLQMNLSLFERTQANIAQSEERERALSQQIDSIRGELSLTDPYQQVVAEGGGVVLTGAQRLSALTAEYLRVSSRYSAEHPDVKRLSREIRILSEQSGDNERIDEIMGQLISLQEQLRQARQTYSDSHPEVLDLERAVASVQKGLQSAVVADQSSGQLEVPPDNPRYVALASQLDAAETNLSAERQRLTDFSEKLVEYEERLFNTPVIERDWKSLSRDYENKQAKYVELQGKLQSARLAEELEGGDSAEKFILASRGYLPTLPESPNRVGIILLGTFFGLVMGLAFVVLVEYFDKTIRNPRMVIATLGAPPLVTIPQMTGGHSR